MARRKNFRQAVFERDEGVCEICHLDTEWIRSEIDRLKEMGAPNSIIDEAFKVHGFVNASSSSLWEGDHIVPLAEGGPDTMDNLRTLCQNCHRSQTKDLKGRLARAPKKKTKCKKCEYAPSWTGAQWVQKCKTCKKTKK